MDEDEFEVTKWWQVIDSQEHIWCETSREIEARESMRPGDILRRLYEKVEREWRVVE